MNVTDTRSMCRVAGEGALGVVAAIGLLAWIPTGRIETILWAALAALLVMGAVMVVAAIRTPTPYWTTAVDAVAAMREQRAARQAVHTNYEKEEI